MVKRVWSKLVIWWVFAGVIALVTIAQTVSHRLSTGDWAWPSTVMFVSFAVLVIAGRAERSQRLTFERRAAEQRAAMGLPPAS